jgi:hypothetical protein
MKALLMDHCDQCGAAAAVEPIIETFWEGPRTLGYRIFVCPDTRIDEPAWTEWEGSPAETLPSACAEMGEALLAHYRAWHQSPEEAAEVAAWPPPPPAAPALEETVMAPLRRQEELNRYLI